jgi:hypothetical protein
VIELSLGCTDDRIVLPSAGIPMAEMFMVVDATGESSAPNVVVDLSQYDSEESGCRSFAKIIVER